MSVNVPTNQKIKEQDVNAKLQLYGIYAGMFLVCHQSRLNGCSRAHNPSFNADT